MASAIFELSKDNGANWLAPDQALAGGNGANAISAGVGSASVRARLVDQSGAGEVTWTITAASMGASPLTVATQIDKSAQISIPRGTPAAYILEARIGSGIDPLTRKTDPNLVKTLAIKVATVGGLELIAPGESTEGNRTFGWTEFFNRVIDGSAGSLVPTPWTAIAQAPEGHLEVRPASSSVATQFGRDWGLFGQSSTHPSAYGGGGFFGVGLGAAFDSGDGTGNRAHHGDLLFGLGTDRDSFAAWMRVRFSNKAGFVQTQIQSLASALLIAPAENAGAGSRTDIGGGQGTAGGDLHVYGGNSTSFGGGAVYISAGHSSNGIPSSVSFGTRTVGNVHLPVMVVESTRVNVVQGRFDVSFSNGRQQSSTALPLTTTNTTAALAWSYAVPVSVAGTLTVQANAFNQTNLTSDDTVWKCTYYRLASGAPVIARAAADQSTPGFANGNSVTFTLSNNTLQVNVKAGVATSTQWTVGIGIIERSIA